MLYHCTDGNAEIEIEADSAEEAAQEYVDDGDWGDDLKTAWVNVRTWTETDEDGDPLNIEWHKITLDPPEPDCRAKDAEHLWSGSHEIVGGIKENPGVWGHGGGCTVTRVCLRCGCERIEDSWAQDPTDGEQGLQSTEYHPNSQDPQQIVRDLLQDRDNEAIEHAETMDIDDLWPDGCTDDPGELADRVREAMTRED